MIKFRCFWYTSSLFLKVVLSHNCSSEWTWIEKTKGKMQQVLFLCNCLVRHCRSKNILHSKLLRAGNKAISVECNYGGTSRRQHEKRQYLSLDPVRSLAGTTEMEAKLCRTQHSNQLLQMTLLTSLTDIIW